ncbi:hypothetical protein SCLCIDRAFT_124978, partial [Scleroderma citrinum Foug A]
CGRSTPPLPLAIQCISLDEATFVMQTLWDVLEPILPEPSTSELLGALSTLTNVRNLLSEDQDGFYAVVVGAPAGIHHTRDSAVNSESTFSWPKWERFDTLHEALAYMVVKGVEELLPPIIPDTSIGELSLI